MEENTYHLGPGTITAYSGAFNFAADNKNVHDSFPFKKYMENLKVSFNPEVSASEVIFHAAYNFNGVANLIFSDGNEHKLMTVDSEDSISCFAGILSKVAAEFSRKIQEKQNPKINTDKILFRQLRVDQYGAKLWFGRGEQMIILSLPYRSNISEIEDIVKSHIADYNEIDDNKELFEFFYLGKSFPYFDVDYIVVEHCDNSVLCDFDGRYRHEPLKGLNIMNMQAIKRYLANNA